jgi:ABC-type nitrate/sulfonate/bicarbonate transport system substrate-binding protein
MSNEVDRIRINVFPGVQNFPNFAAEHKAFFQRHGLAVEMTFTKSSNEQRNALATGACDIAHSAVDNALALVDAGVDTAVVVGLDHGFNKLIVRPEITSYGDLRGRIFGVDAVDTAFALLAYEIFRRKGLIKETDYKVQAVGATRFRLEALINGDVDFAMLNLPFNLLAQKAGLKLLDDPIDVVGPYQSTAGFVRRDWAAANRDRLTRYIAAYIEGLRWVTVPANRAEAIGLLADRMQLAPQMAEGCYQRVTDPSRGFARDAKIDGRGMDCVVKLRNEFSPKGGALRSTPQYVDETYYNAALVMLADAPLVTQ